MLSLDLIPVFYLAVDRTPLAAPRRGPHTDGRVVHASAGPRSHRPRHIQAAGLTQETTPTVDAVLDPAPPNRPDVAMGRVAPPSPHVTSGVVARGTPHKRDGEATGLDTGETAVPRPLVLDQVGGQVREVTGVKGVGRPGPRVQVTAVEVPAGLLGHAGRRHIAIEVGAPSGQRQLDPQRTFQVARPPGAFRPRAVPRDVPDAKGPLPVGAPLRVP